jgi:hypothetical protein
MWPFVAVEGKAAMLVYPSLYEGLGLPPLEAMACGTPVITSNSPKGFGAPRTLAGKAQPRFCWKECRRLLPYDWGLWYTAHWQKVDEGNGYETDHPDSVLE